ncbi:UDP-N-acetylmuramoyl-tripeptide--D-alanyl-D-alanine ligase [Patescibacteria group bacterium]|nr:UDP-N-acetylmuramoyl-tripeptide--D-alanyl-D-alanine ligase [Patescibacteria group bacterium]
MLLKVLQKTLAWFARRVIKKYQPLIIGITGSVGKSSAKEAIYNVLKDQMNVWRSLKNYNNEIGVPLTVLGCISPRKNIFGWLKVFWIAIKKIVFPEKSYPKVLVLEMAADRPGDIEYLTKIIPCQIGIITAIGPTHTEFFKSVENIVKEKQAIISHLPLNGWAILNADDEKVRVLKNKTSAKVLTFGLSSNADVQAMGVSLDQELKDDLPQIKGLRFKISYKGNVVPIFLSQIITSAQIYSILTAISIGLTFNLNLITIAQAVKKYRPLPGRMVLVKGVKQSLIIDDTYNSSPKAVELALETLLEIKTHPQAKKWVILGDMLELGELSQSEHHQVGQSVGKMNFDYLITVGQEAKEIVRGAQEYGLSQEKIFSFADSFEVGKFLQKKIKKGDLILIKGSQGARLERIVKEIMLEPEKAEKLLVRQGKEWL